MVLCPALYEFAQPSTYLGSSTAREDDILPYNSWVVISSPNYHFTFSEKAAAPGNGCGGFQISMWLASRALRMAIARMGAKMMATTALKMVAGSLA